MCLFGIGFGITQNATFALMIDRAPGADHAEAAYVISEVEVLDETQGQRYRELAAASGLDAAPAGGSCRPVHCGKRCVFCGLKTWRSPPSD